MIVHRTEIEIGLLRWKRIFVNRRTIGWLVMLGAPGASFSSLLIAAMLLRHYNTRVTPGSAAIVVCVTMFLAVCGSGFGATLLRSEPEQQRLAVPLAMLAGLGVFVASVFVAERVAGLL
jgi:hypothetical protein